MYTTVYLNAKTEGRTVNNNAWVNFVTDSTGKNLKADPAGIIMKFIVCGNEALSISTAGTPSQSHVILDTDSSLESISKPYISWFDLTIGASSHAACNIEKYFLGGCFTPGYANVEYNNAATHKITMASSSAPTQNDIFIQKNDPLVEKVCLWAQTRGKVLKQKEIDIEVCGSETVTLSGSNKHTFDILYRDFDLWTDKRYKYVYFNSLHPRFVSASSNCPIRYWSLFDSDGTTPLADSTDIKVENDGVKLAVSTENFNWTKKLFLKNKILNPNGVCNW